VFLLLDKNTKKVHSISFKVGVHLKAVFWLGIMVLTQISLSRFKQSEISLFRPTYLRFGLVFKFFGDFWVYLGKNSFKG